MMFKITKCIFLGNLLIKYYMAKKLLQNKPQLIDNIRRRAEDRQAAYKWTKFELKMYSIMICGNFISLRYVAIQHMKIYTGNLFVLPELL